MQSRSQTYHPARVSDQGLRVNLPGLSLGLWRRRFRPHVFLRVNSTSWYSISSDRDELPCPSDTDNVHLALILQQSEWLLVDDLSSTDAIGVLIVALRLRQVENAGVISAEPLCLGDIQKANRFEGWVGALEQLRTRFYAKCRPYLDIVETLEVDGTALGHFNENSTTNSDISAIWTDGQLSFDLEDQHMMFEVDLIPKEQEWCIG